MLLLFAIDVQRAMSENIAREQVKDVAKATLTDHLASTDWVPAEPAKPEEKEEGEVKVVSAHISLIFNMNSATSYCSIMCTAVRCLLMYHVCMAELVLPG